MAKTDYNQILLDKWYTQEQIDAMRQSASSWGSAKDIVNAGKSVATPTPVTPTPTPTPTPAPTYNNNNLGGWNYWDNSVQRQEQIVNNLNDAYAKNPNQFSSREAFASAFNYDYAWRSDTERQTMKSWYESKFWPTTPNVNKTVKDAVRDKNNNLHVTYTDGSTEIIPWGTWTQQGQQWGQSGLSDNGKTYTFQPWYEPIYPEWVITWDKSTSIANLWALQKKSETLTYQEDSEARYNQILWNLDRIYMSNPEFFTDRTTFDANFQLDQRSIGQQQIMVEWFYNKKKQERDYDAIGWLNDGQSIYDAIQNWNLTQDQLDLLKGTPQYSEYLSITKDKLELATINNDPSMFFVNNLPATLEDLKVEIMATIDNMTKYNMWEYMLSLYDWPEYEQVRDNVYNATRNAKERQAEYDSVESNVRNRLEWTWATKAYINAVIAREQNDLVPWLNLAYAQLQAEQTNYQLRHQSLVDKYGSYVDQANYEVTRYNAQVGAFQTMWGIYRDVAQYDWNYKQQVRLLELQNSYNNPMLDSTDPDEAKRALKQTLQSYYDAYWPIIKRDINKVMQDVYAYAKAHNCSLAEALQKDFVDQLEWKPEYKELKKQYLYGREYLYSKPWTSSSSSSSSWAWGAWGGLWEWAWGYNWWTQTADVTDTTIADGVVSSVLAKYQEKYTDWTTWGTDEDLVNNYLNALWLWNNNVGTSYQDKLSIINDNTPQAGSIAVIDWTWTVGIVTSVDYQNGTVTLMESDVDGDNKVSTQNVHYMKDIAWYINPAKALTYQTYNGNLPQTEFVSDSGRIIRVNDKWFIDSLIAQYKKYNENGKISESVAWLQETLDSYGISGSEFRSQAENYSKFSDDAMNYLYGVAWEYGMVSYLIDKIDELGADWVSWDTVKKNKEFSAYLDNLIERKTLDYFLDLKQQWATFGAMSDAEWNIIWQATTAISELGDSIADVWVNREALKRELMRMETNLYSILQNTPAYYYADKGRLSDAMLF